jgi:hypothetical protein
MVLGAYSRHPSGRLHGDFHGLGAITADQAAQTAMPKNTIRGKAGFTQAVYDEIVKAAQSGQFTDYNGQATSCVTGPSTTGQRVLSLVGTGAGLGLQASVTYGLIAAGPATMGITIAIAGITALFSTIFAHHAAAVAKENRILCASGPAANNYLQIIDQAVQEGKATPAQAVQALHSLLSDYTSTVQPIIKNNSGQCNAACVELKELTAIVAYKSSLYQDMANAPAPAQVTSSGPSSAAAVSSGSVMVLPTSGTAAGATPSWLPIAALLIGGFLLAKVV